MKLRVVLFLILAVSVMPVWAIEDNDGIGDDYFPELGNPGYDVLTYDIHVDALLPATSFAADVTITAQALEPLASFHLDFGGYDIARVTVNGVDAPYTRRKRELEIIPVTPLVDAETFTVRVVYAGEPRSARGTSPFSGGWFNYTRGVYVASEPDGASLWFPSNDHPRDKALFTINVGVPTGYVAAANGTLTETTTDANGLQRYVWVSTYPMATYLATIHIADFVVQESVSPEGIVIRNYFPRTLAPQLEDVFAAQGEMLDFFSTIIAPYPFEAYGAGVADTSFGFALETQTLSLFPADMLQSDVQSANDTIAHEMAHQWFGNSVSVKNWDDIWLNEGFAMYMAALWLEHAEGKAAFNALLENYYAAVSGMGSFKPLNDPGADDLFNGFIYVRGALVLHALRLEVGDETFFAILRAYYDEYQYSNAEIADFIRVASTVSNRDLTEFFHNWLEERRMPRLTFDR